MLEEFFLAEKAMSKGSRIQEVLMNRHAIKEIYSRGLIFKIIVQQETDMAVLREEFKQQQLFVHELDQTSFLLSPPLVMSEQELDFLIGKLMHIFPVVSMVENQVV
jgi:acetylornithine/succinyldiaminopimelate/putrescine aminotransferase